MRHPGHPVARTARFAVRGFLMPAGRSPLGRGRAYEARKNRGPQTRRSALPALRRVGRGGRSRQRDPSPDPRRLEKAPSRATISRRRGLYHAHGGVCLEAHTSGQTSGRMRHPRYISLERIIEENKDRDYETLEQSSRRLARWPSRPLAVHQLHSVRTKNRLRRIRGAGWPNHLPPRRESRNGSGRGPRSDGGVSPHRHRAGLPRGRPRVGSNAARGPEKIRESRVPSERPSRPVAL